MPTPATLRAPTTPTHTCIHVHTQIVPSPQEIPNTTESVEAKGRKRPAGNREAVKKYREKKKARAASLDEEVVRLKALNQHLMMRIQGQALLEAEVARLKCLLVDVRGRIEGELGSFPYKKPSTNIASTNVLPGICAMNSCNMQCNESEAALNGGQGVGDCEFDNLRCFGNQNSELKELSGSYKDPSAV